MKSYGRIKKIKHNYKNYHLHPKRRWKNWWEDEMNTIVSRGRLNQIVKNQIKEELNLLINFFESQSILEQDFQDALDELVKSKVGNKPKKERF